MTNDQNTYVCDNSIIYKMILELKSHPAFEDETKSVPRSFFVENGWGDDQINKYAHIAIRHFSEYVMCKKAYTSPSTNEKPHIIWVMGSIIRKWKLLVSR